MVFASFELNTLAGRLLKMLLYFKSKRTHTRKKLSRNTYIKGTKDTEQQVKTFFLFTNLYYIHKATTSRSKQIYFGFFRTFNRSHLHPFFCIRKTLNVKCNLFSHFFLHALLPILSLIKWKAYKRSRWSLQLHCFSSKLPYVHACVCFGSSTQLHAVTYEHRTAFWHLEIDNTYLTAR